MLKCNLEGLKILRCRLPGEAGQNRRCRSICKHPQWDLHQAIGKIQIGNDSFFQQLSQHCADNEIDLVNGTAQYDRGNQGPDLL